VDGGATIPKDSSATAGIRREFNLVNFELIISPKGGRI